MKPCLLDTDTLSLFFRGHPRVTDRVAEYVTQYRQINISIITYYEIVSGLKHRDAKRKLSVFLDFASHNTVLPLTEDSVNISADIYADLRKRGRPLDDVDILLAGVAIANGLVLATHNRKHFDRIARLEVNDWAAD